MEIAGETDDLKNRKYKIVTTQANFPKALDYGHGVLEIVPRKRWWQWWRPSDDALPMLNISEEPAQPKRGPPIVCEAVEWTLPAPSQDIGRYYFSKLAAKRVKLNKAASSSKEGGAGAGAQ